MRPIRPALVLVCALSLLLAQMSGLHFHAVDADPHEHGAIHEHDHVHASAFHDAAIDHDDLAHFVTAIQDGVGAAMGTDSFDWTPFVLGLLTFAGLLQFKSTVFRPPTKLRVSPHAERHWRPPLRAPPH
jgi:hypothetical protein